MTVDHGLTIVLQGSCSPTGLSLYFLHFQHTPAAAVRLQHATVCRASGCQTSASHDAVVDARPASDIGQLPVRSAVLRDERLGLRDRTEPHACQRGRAKQTGPGSQPTPFTLDPLRRTQGNRRRVLRASVNRPIATVTVMTLPCRKHKGENEGREKALRPLPAMLRGKCGKQREAAAW
jgi:hypothetical protein